MKTYHFDPGRVHLLRLATGGDVYDDITDYIGSLRIEAATVSLLGAVQRASLRYYDQDEKAYRDFVIDEHLEVAAGVGNVSLLDGEPFLHVHVALSDAAGRGYGGHLNSGTTVFAIEVAISELDGVPPVRLPDDCTGLSLWGGTLEEGAS